MNKELSTRAWKSAARSLGEEYVNKAMANAEHLQHADAGTHHRVVLGLVLGP